MKISRRVVFGIAFIAVGLILGLNALNITDIDIFFDGWWTLFIIVPCTIGLFNSRDKMGNIIGIAVGVFLLLCCLEILSFSMLWKLFVPVVIVVLGLKMVFSGAGNGKANAIMAKIKEGGNVPKVCCATFSSCEMKCDGEFFDGAELTAVFGGVNCDLRNAFIDKDCVIQVYSVFGGIDILVPDNVNVKVNTTCIFGGVSNKTAAKKDVPTVYVSGTCLFGGVDVK